MPYSPQRSDAYLWGVYHVHSSMSDGLQSPREIALQARVARVAGPSHRSWQPGPGIISFSRDLRWRNDCGRFGSEFARRTTHLFWRGKRSKLSLVILSSRRNRRRPRMGRVSCLAYPDDPRYQWRYWNTDLRPGGIEVLNLFTSLRSGSWTDRLLLAMFYPFSHYYFLKRIVVPAESIAHWDALLQRDKIWGFAASDAHGGFHITPWLSIKLPSYADTFSFAGLGIDRQI